MKERVVVFLLVLVSLGANDVGPTKSELEAMYGAAAEEVNAGRYGAALKQLNAIDARQPDMAAAKNLRGVALMRMGDYGPAEKALHKARELDPDLWEARFNLAEVPFLQKNWAEARHRFEGLAAEKNEQAQGAIGGLIQFKILLTWLLQGREKQAAEILGRLQEASSPAYYCGKAAFAFRHKDETEARVALKAAEKTFSPELNQLFRESFYEVGWLEKAEGAMPVALEVSSQADRVAKAQESFGRAERAYRQGDYESALQLLDGVDAAAPNQAVSYNLRGEVLLAQGKPDEAEASFHNALAADPQFADARFNLALVPFRKGDYDESRKQFEALLGATGGGTKERRREELIRYEIFLTLLREGRDPVAQKAMDEFKMMDETPALYYAQAAWAFQHGNFKQGNNWVANADNLYSAELNRSFAAPFAALGWLKGRETEPTPAETALADTHPTPTAEATLAPVATEKKAKEIAAIPKPTATSTPREEKERAAPAVLKNETPSSSTPLPQESPSPEEVADAAPPPKEAAAAEKEKPADEVSGRVAKKKKPERRSARARSEENEEKPQRKPIEIRRALPVYPIQPTPTPHENLGDKVRGLLLSPFKHRPEKAENPAPNGSVPSAQASATPTPPGPGTRKN
ncbi:MAG TPA: tetratricopeptide repeat protein [Chthoniobacterales bacterium]|nr:tetratricopeptide repeat protein [Chthoniobacterales bacterium]